MPEDVETCPHSKDGRGHCNCWWEMEPCCWCKSDEGDKGDGFLSPGGLT